MRQKGFTVLEMLIVGVIVAVVVSLIAASFSSFRLNQGLGNATDTIKTALEEARSKTLSSQDGYQYGVHFEASRVVLFRSAVYNAAATTNTIFNLPNTTEISTFALNGGGSDLVFKKIVGKTDQYGSVTIRLKADTGRTKVVSINANGAVNVQ